MWKDIVSAVAPILGSAIGGPVGGLAARALSQAVLGKPDASEKELATAIEGASPETLLKLKQADQDFKLRMEELDIDLERIHQQDRSSAREREARTGDSWTPRVLASVVLAGFMGTVFMVLAGFVDGLMDPMAASLIGTLIGYVSAKADQVVSYYFGSSAGSKAKDAAMAGMAGGTRK